MGSPQWGQHGDVREPGDFPKGWLGNQPREQSENETARRGNCMHGLGSAAYLLQYYHRESERANNVAKQRSISKVSAAQ